MRFIADAHNLIGMCGIAFAAGVGWSAGCWLGQRVLAAIRI